MKNIIKKSIFILIFIGLLTIATLLCFYFVDSPFIWIFLIYSIVFGVGALVKVGSKVKILFINISVILLTLSIFEGYLASKTTTPKTVKKHSSWLNKYDDKLGYRPISDHKVNVKKLYKDQLIYDVLYTIDTGGLRVAPKFIKNENQKCILFFGGSITFGEGVNDDESMPFRIGVKTNGLYRIYNFGYIGYGPHQMLAAIEFGLVEEVLKCSPEYVFFQTMPGHIKRSAGKSSWDHFGPFYKIVNGGEVEYFGSFQSNKKLRTIISDIFIKSRIYSKILGDENPVSPKDINNYLAIVRKARNTLVDRYPKASFQVIYWDYVGGDSVHEEVITGFNRDRINLHLISNILPEFQSKSKKYIIKYDGHPNPMAHNIIADYVVKEIIN
jgi:hypothetical protein